MVVTLGVSVDYAALPPRGVCHADVLGMAYSETSNDGRRLIAAVVEVGRAGHCMAGGSKA